MIPERLPRLESILHQIPQLTASRVLSVGCGTYPSALTLRRTRPGWTLYGIDVDAVALRQAASNDRQLRLLQADIRDLPELLRQSFGLIMVRHPDLFRHPQTWEHVIPRLPLMLAPGGSLLITLYSPHEAALLEGFCPPLEVALDPDALISVDLAGRDRFVSVFSTEVVR